MPLRYARAGGAVRAVEDDPAAAAAVVAHVRAGRLRAGSLLRGAPCGGAPIRRAARGRAAPARDRAGARAGACSRAGSRGLVAGERHPLGQHVVRGGQAGRPPLPLRSGNSTQYSLQQPAAARARRPRSACAGRPGTRRPGGAHAPVGLAAGVLAAHADEAEVAVHRPLLVVHAGAQQLAGALLGAPLATGVVELAARRTARGRAPGRRSARRRSTARSISGAASTSATRARASSASSIAGAPQPPEARGKKITRSAPAGISP